MFDRGIALVGASGGVYALIGAHFGNMLMVCVLVKMNFDFKSCDFRFYCEKYSLRY